MHLDNKVVAASIKLLCSRAHNDIKAFISESVEENMLFHRAGGSGWASLPTQYCFWEKGLVNSMTQL